MTRTMAYDPVAVGTLEFWALPPAERDERLRRLRDERPVSWQPPAEGSMLPQEDGSGFWAITRHADIQTVSKAPEDFCSGRGIQVEDIPEDILEAASSFLATDAPRHTRLRRLVSAAFTPKQVRTISEQIRAQARRIVDDLVETGDCDFVEHVARRLPMWTIYEMFGLPEERRDDAARAADAMVSWADDDVRGDREPADLLTDALTTLIGTGIELAEARRADPRDDLMTSLVRAEVEGEKLTDEDVASFFVLLSVAGNDTTRNTITRTMQALTLHPEQRALLRADFDATIGTAVEEFVRWASPVMTFRRVATRDVELGGQRIRDGDWVVMYYASGNRDERVFADPWRFDVTRSPNPHVGFGGGGPHFCMGTMLARTQLRSIFAELLARVPDLEAGDPVPVVGNFVDGLKAMPCRLNL